MTRLSVTNKVPALLLGLAVVSMALPPSAHAVTLRINTPKFELELAPGQTATGVLEAENPSEKDLAVKIYPDDWQFKGTGTGEKNFFPGGTLPDSASKWVTLNVSDAIMPPYSKKQVNFSLKVPEDAKGTYHTVVFFESLAGNVQNEEGANVLVTARIGAIFTVRVKGTIQRQGRIEEIQINPPLENSPAKFAVTFANTGNTDITLKGNVLIMGADGLVKGRGGLEDIITQAGQTGTRTSEWVGRLAPGTYDLIFTFDLGEGQLLTEERKMTIG